MNEMERMRDLVARLNAAAKVYYQGEDEIMTNFEYDALYDELVALEEKTGVVLSGSPTVQVGYETLSELPKEAHIAPMLSLGKTKEREELVQWLTSREGLLSLKLDGLSVILTYQNGFLVKALTRGNGEIGEVITNNAKTFKNIPAKIPYTGTLVIRGEALIRYSDFKVLNESFSDIQEKYKNPRNLCSGSVRQLNNEITARRHVQFFAFSLVRADGVDFENSREKQFTWLSEQGFDVVEHKMVTRETVEKTVAWFAEEIENNPIPSDGLVAIYDDIAYGISLGRTAKFPRDAFAFKWADEIKETHLLSIEWSPSRTGLINPVAIFEPVELEGTTVSRASVHNLSIMKALQLGIGDTIQVYKANMIIPQIAENLTRSGNIEIPQNCPVCGGVTRIQRTADVETLYCTNPECQAKKIKSFALFVSRDAMNMEGMSEATLEKFIGSGFIHEFADIFRLSRYKDAIVEMEGFGEKSYEKLMAGIGQARNTTLPRLIYSLGIPNIGVANAKMICKAFDYDLEKIRTADAETMAGIDGIGEVIGAAVADYFQDAKKAEQLDDLLEEIHLEKYVPNETEQIFAGKNFVITGSLIHFANRNELKAKIEEKGGKVTGSVTSKTDYLINNDTQSSTSKNKKAKELEIPVISEEDFLGMLEQR